MKFQDAHMTVELADVLTYLKVDPEKKSFVNEAQKALEMAYSLMMPGILYQKGAIRKSSSPTLFINHVEFTNKALFYNLSDTDECFLYIITLGNDYSVKVEDASDYLLSYYLDKIGTLLLGALRVKLIAYLETEYGVKDLSRMSPGSTTLWQLHENRTLFSVFADEIDQIGVSLNKNCVMNPIKTVSGIMFSKDTPFFDCFLCQDKECQGRKAGYNSKIAEFYHHL